MQASDYWPAPTAHRDFWERHNNPYVYEYDPTDDGPEVEAIIAVRINHPEATFIAECADYQFATMLLDKVAKTFKDPAMREAMLLRGVTL